MDLFDRIYKAHEIFRNARLPVERLRLQQGLECSRATVMRILRDMKENLSAPIEYDPKAGGYRYNAAEGTGPYELPGLWLNASELQALLAMQSLLAGIQPGLLETHLAPLKARIEQILKSKRAVGGPAARHIRLVAMASRYTDPRVFQAVAGAALQRKRLKITYHSRSADVVTERILTPHRLVHYRDNWYLDAYDHHKRALRSFALDRVRRATVTTGRAQPMRSAKLNAYFASAYGIFSGTPKHRAVLRFSPERARWVADETWHPKQTGRFENQYYILEVPYSDSRELVMDILKHTSHVEVLVPETLKQEVTRCLEAGLRLHKAEKAEK